MVAAQPFRDGFSLAQILRNRYFQESFRPVYPLMTFFSLGYSPNTDLYPWSVLGTLLFIWAVLLFAVYKLVQQLFFIQSTIMALCLSQLVCSALYFLTTAKVELFGFVSAAEIHVLPTVFVFVAAWLIIKKHSITDFLFLPVSAFFIAGGSDHIGAVTLALIAVTGMLYLSKKENRNSFNGNLPLKRKTIFFTIALGIFFLAFVTNPGLWNHYRDAQNYTLQNPDQYHTHVIPALKMFLSPGKFIGLLILFVSILMLLKISGKAPNIKINYFIVAFIAAAFVCAVTGKLAYNSYMVSRVWFPADAAFFVLAGAIFLKYIPRIKFTDGAFLTGALSMLLILLVFNIRHMPRLIKFQMEFDQMIADLRKSPPNQIITVQKFPDSDLTSQASFSEDPNDDMNILFCRFYHIPAKVSVKN